LSDGQKSPAALLTRRPKGVTFVRLDAGQASQARLAPREVLARAHDPSLVSKRAQG